MTNSLSVSKELESEPSSVRQTPFQVRIKGIAEIFNLTEVDTEIVTFVYLKEMHEQLVESISKDRYRSSSRFGVVELSSILGRPKSELTHSLSKKGVLKRAEILEKTYDNDLKLSASVMDYLSGLSRDDLLSNFFKRASLDEALKIEDHNIEKVHIAVVENLIGNELGQNILLYGTPGSGKTELSKSLGAVLKKNVFFINQKDEENGGSRTSRKTSIYAAINMLNPKTDIIVVDECDDIINSYRDFSFFRVDDSDSKAWVNELLEESRQKIIWITNDCRGVDESTKRRFDYAIEFFELGSAYRENVWQTQIKKNKATFVDAKSLKRLASEYKVNAGTIAMALKNANSARGPKHPNEKIKLLESIIKQQQIFMYGVKRHKTQSLFDLEILNIDVPPEKLVMSASRFYDHLVENDRDMVNLSYLFQGSPGTGKTEFARYLSEALGRELLVKRLSDIRSPWYGESLKNIANMFREAEATNKILFLDEADTIFVNREEARDLHAAETNELLTQMENFRGILICATNFMNAMDHAVMRRFAFKVKFDYLKSEAKVRLFNRYFEKTITQKMEQKLKKIQPLTPGDFKVVKQKISFAGDESAENLISLLEIESSYKKEKRGVGLLNGF